MIKASRPPQQLGSRSSIIRDGAVIKEKVLSS